MKNIFIVNVVGDPYEGDQSIGWYSSLEKAMDLTTGELWKLKSSRPNPKYPQYADDFGFQLHLHEELKSKRTLEICGSLDRPSPYVQTIRLDDPAPISVN